MQRYEYKTAAVKVTGDRQRGSLAPDLQSELNAFAAQGWRAISVLPPTWMGFKKTIIVFERPVEA